MHLSPEENYSMFHRQTFWTVLQRMTLYHILQRHGRRRVLFAFFILHTCISDVWVNLIPAVCRFVVLWLLLRYYEDYDGLGTIWASLLTKVKSVMRVIAWHSNRRCKHCSCTCEHFRYIAAHELALGGDLKPVHEQQYNGNVFQLQTLSTTFLHKLFGVREDRKAIAMICAT